MGLAIFIGRYPLSVIRISAEFRIGASPYDKVLQIFVQNENSVHVLWGCDYRNDHIKFVN